MIRLGRTYYTLDDLASLWRVSLSEIEQWLLRGDLRASVWVPIMSVYELEEVTLGSCVSFTKKLCHWSGYSSFSHHHYYKIFKQGSSRLREFYDSKGVQQFLIHETAEEISVSLKELVILRAECIRFEGRHGFSGCFKQPEQSVEQGTETSSYSDNLNFRVIHFEGENHQFGEIQARILKLLYDAQNQGEPWQSGKVILKNAGSQSFTLSNIFKHKPVWKKIIISDKRGRYRLLPDLKP